MHDFIVAVLAPHAGSKIS